MEATSADDDGGLPPGGPDDPRKGPDHAIDL
jgi:hypothetical protein